MERFGYYIYLKAFWASTLKKIVIVGGGTAGWLTALYAKKVYLNDEIVLVESEEYGILGAGEGSTPHLVDFLEFLQIPVADVIKYCKATIKTSIKFTNWTASKGFYHHPFYMENCVTNEKVWSLNNFYLEEVTSLGHLAAAAEGHDFNDYSILQKAGENYQVPFIQNKATKILEPQSIYALHFDAKLFAEYLKSVAISRGVIRKEGIISKIIADEEGYITTLKTNKESIKCDFVFDCSGFRRLIIGDFYKSPWRSYADRLPAKKALPFFLPMENEIPPYTEAIAMKYGWIWKIPLQDRYGCGYVFDSDYITDAQAVEEIENYLGFEPTYPRKEKGAFNFAAGSYEKIWVKNVLAVGLASGFVEPAEATSIMQTVIVLRRFLSNVDNCNIRNPKVQDYFNQVFSWQMNESVDFIYLHYAGLKTDTEFWRDFTLNNRKSDKVQYILDVMKEKVLTRTFDFYECSIFESTATNWILIGNGVLDKETLIRLGAPYLTDKRRKEYLKLLEQDNALLEKFMNHKQFLTILNSNK